MASRQRATPGLELETAGAPGPATAGGHRAPLARHESPPHDEMVRASRYTYKLSYYCNVHCGRTVYAMKLRHMPLTIICKNF